MNKPQLTVLDAVFLLRNVVHRIDGQFGYGTASMLINCVTSHGIYNGEKLRQGQNTSDVSFTRTATEVQVAEELSQNHYGINLIGLAEQHDEVRRLRLGDEGTRPVSSEQLPNKLCDFNEMWYCTCERNPTQSERVVEGCPHLPSEHYRKLKSRSSRT